MRALRVRKLVDEYARLKRNSKIADTAHAGVMAVLKARLREKDIAAIVRQSFENQGAQA